MMGKVKFSKKIVIIIVIMVVIFCLIDFYVFLKVGAEPTMLVGAFFSFVSVQLWSTASIKKAEIKKEANDGVGGDSSEIYNTGDICNNSEVSDSDVERMEIL